MVDDPLVLDACVTLNLSAIVPLADLPRLLGRRAVMVQTAVEEVLYLWGERDGEPFREPVDLTGLEVIQLTGAELDGFVRLAARLDDGEAASIAVAQARGWPIATDDRAARRALQLEPSEVEVLSSERVIRRIVTALGLDETQIARQLRNVQMRARYRPGGNHEDAVWWRRMVARHPG